MCVVFVCNVILLRRQNCCISECCAGTVGCALVSAVLVQWAVQWWVLCWYCGLCSGECCTVLWAVQWWVLCWYCGLCIEAWHQYSTGIITERLKLTDKIVRKMQRRNRRDSFLSPLFFPCLCCFNLLVSPVLSYLWPCVCVFFSIYFYVLTGGRQTREHKSKEIRNERSK